MGWYSSKKICRLSNSSLIELINNSNVVKSPYCDYSHNGFDREIYFSSRSLIDRRDYILVTEIRTPVSYNVLDKRLRLSTVLIRVISNNKKISDSIIKNVSAKIKRINKKEILEARV